MSRRQLTLLVVALVSFAATACGTASTAPRHDDDSTAAIVTAGSGG
jgi:hypothetical protein